jgi:hypothetical protein
MKINWTESRTEDARIFVNDDVITSYATEDDLPEQFGLREIAEVYAASYDHNGNEETFTVAEIEDLADGETHRFAFAANGNFEWDTARR